MPCYTQHFYRKPQVALGIPLARFKKKKENQHMYLNMLRVRQQRKHKPALNKQQNK